MEKGDEGKNVENVLSVAGGKGLKNCAAMPIRDIAGHKYGILKCIGQGFDGGRRRITLPAGL
ncbi:hypothetical protein [Geobacter metallireducens]|uniref:hypothetical protein n=1 Tax=Geobacter metallireducens TaxID=28232 RepID=UPI001110F9DC|nr:hypothetical protein [Geobacter metallireducens]